ncbi:MAG: phosphate signaling complex protein PhoU [Ruminococcaceae bacterium]|nr:phosphate signaling complex protein PhoU [Oscillospiraceae bacterium]
MRDRFAEQLKELNEELTSMGALCQEAIALSAKALTDGNMELAERVAEIEEEIDHKEREIENLCFKLLLQQQPVAGDLRTVSSALKMITDMERIGDQALDIAEIVRTANIHTSKDTHYIRDMALETIKMVTESVDAYVKKDADIARAVIRHDDVVDDYFNKIKTMLTDMFKKPDADAEYCLDLLMIAKYFERIGDHAVNIGEWVLYSLTGTHKK